jgi:hypothetical protein
VTPKQNFANIKLIETAQAGFDAPVWRTLWAKDELRPACGGLQRISLKPEFNGDTGLYKQSERLNIQDRLDILLENRLSGVAEQKHIIVYGKSRV